MLKQIKTLGLVIVIGSTMVGCANKKDEFTTTLTNIESEITMVNDAINSTETYDAVLLQQILEDIDKIQKDIEVAQEEYEEDETEYKALEAIDTYLSYEEEIGNDTREKNEEFWSDREEISKRISSYKIKMEEAWEQYENYKKELGIETTPIVSTISEEPVKEKESKVEEQKQEEKKVESKQTYCEWCEANTNHNSDEHIGQCYDCGEEKPAGQMTYNGRSFHCGCIVAYCEECGSGLTEESKVKMGDMLFCRSCYDNRMALTEPVAECYECGTGMTAAHDIYYYFDQPVCSACYKSLTSNNCSVCGGDTEGSEIYHNDARYCLDCYMEAVEGLEN